MVSSSASLHVLSSTEKMREFVLLATHQSFLHWSTTYTLSSSLAGGTCHGYIRCVQRNLMSWFQGRAHEELNSTHDIDFECTRLLVGGGHQYDIFYIRIRGAWGKQTGFVFIACRLENLRLFRSLFILPRAAGLLGQEVLCRFFPLIDLEVS